MRPLEMSCIVAYQLAVIVGFVVIGFAAGTGDWNHFSEPAVRTSTVSLPAQFVISLLWVMVGYSGWNAATYVAEEVKRPERTLPAALAVGTALVAALYVGLNLVFIYSTPLEKMKGVLAIGSLSASNLFGPGVAGIFSGLMALSITSSSFSTSFWTRSFTCSSQDIRARRGTPQVLCP